MARYRGTIEGQRGPASRLGSASSGLRVTCHGWQSGVTVTARVLDDGPGSVPGALKPGEDIFTIEATSGNGYNDRRRFTIGYVTRTKKGLLVFRRSLASVPDGR